MAKEGSRKERETRLLSLLFIYLFQRKLPKRREPLAKSIPQ